MTRPVSLALLLTFFAIAGALLSGAHRRGALLGAGGSSFTALASLLLLRASSRARRPMQAAVAVMALSFLVRILLVALGTALVVRAGESVPGFVVAFFVPFFLFAALEGAYVHALGRTSRTA